MDQTTRSGRNVKKRVIDGTKLCEKLKESNLKNGDSETQSNSDGEKENDRNVTVR